MIESDNKLAYSMVLEIINQMSKNQKSSLIVWNTVVLGSHCKGTKLFYISCGNFVKGESLLGSVKQ